MCMGIFPTRVTVTEEGVRSPGGGCEPTLGAWNRTWVLQKMN